MPKATRLDSNTITCRTATASLF